MNSPSFSSTNLSQLRHQLDSWRQRQPGRPRLPAALWDAAALLAQAHGVSRVSQTLRIDYYKLQRRTLTPTPASPTAPPAFLELRLDSQAPRQEAVGAVELFDGPQRRFRLETGANPAAWVALAEAFWRAKP